MVKKTIICDICNKEVERQDAFKLRLRKLGEGEEKGSFVQNDSDFIARIVFNKELCSECAEKLKNADLSKLL